MNCSQYVACRPQFNLNGLYGLSFASNILKAARELKASETSVLYFYRINDELRFNSPQCIKYSIVNGNYEIELRKGALLITGFGHSIKEAQQDFLEELQYAWDCYSNEDDENLTNNAQTAKKWLRENITKE